MLPEPRSNISSRHYQRLVAKIEGKPEERILSYLMLRSLRQARYSAENRGPLRAGGAHLYAFHFAHPAVSGSDGAPAAARRADGRRRDCGRGTEARSPRSVRSSERRAADAERELVEWKKVKFMAERVGEDFDALVISTAKYGLFVELADLFIEGLVPIDTLPGDRVHLSGEHAQGGGPAHAAGVFDRRPGARDSGSRGRQRAEAAVFGFGR